MLSCVKTEPAVLSSGATKDCFEHSCAGLLCAVGAGGAAQHVGLFAASFTE